MTSRRAGTSSILAAAVLAAVGAATGRHLSQDALIHAVCRVEQLLTTGGGWQDQVGGVVGGFKLGRSEHGLPLRVHANPLPVPEDAARAFDECARMHRAARRARPRAHSPSLPSACCQSPLPRLHRPHAPREAPAAVRGAPVVRRRPRARAAHGGHARHRRGRRARARGRGHADAREVRGRRDPRLRRVGGQLTARRAASRHLCAYWEQKQHMAEGACPPHVHRLIQAVREHGACAVVRCTVRRP